MSELTNKDKKDILKQSKRQKEAEYYNLQIEHEVAQEVEDAQRAEKIKEAMVKVKKGIKVIEARIEELS